MLFYLILALIANAFLLLWIAIQREERAHKDE